MSTLLQRAQHAVEQGNAVSVEYVLLQLDIGETYLRLADTTGGSVCSGRFLAKSQLALDRAVCQGKLLKFTEDERRLFERRVSDLRSGLK
jgi:hypothetical protein